MRYPAAPRSRAGRWGQVGILGGLLLALAGCGNSSSYHFDQPSSDYVSCDRNTGGAHVCTDYSLSGYRVEARTSDIAQACANQGGGVGLGCATAGAVGGCLMMDLSGDLIITTWDYSDTPASVHQMCGTSGGTFVAP